MSYATPADVSLRYQEPLLAQLTDPLGVAVDDTILQQALDDATALINSYLPSGYDPTLPDGAVHVLKLKACDIAVYNLMSLRAAGDLEDQRSRYEDALRFLRDVSNGRVVLGASSGTTPSASFLAPTSSARTRLFDRSSLSGFTDPI